MTSLYGTRAQEGLILRYSGNLKRYVLAFVPHSPLKEFQKEEVTLELVFCEDYVYSSLDTKPFAVLLGTAGSGAEILPRLASGRHN